MAGKRIMIDRELLCSVGLGDLDQLAARDLLRVFHERLELRVGELLCERLSDEQSDEFTALLDANDEAGALERLQRTVPDYRAIVKSTFEDFVEQLRAEAPEILRRFGTHRPQAS